MFSLKNILTLFFIIQLTIFFSSCAKDNGALTPNPSLGQSNNQATSQIIGVNSNTLVGDWKMTSLSYAGSSTTSVGGTSTTTQFTGLGKSFTYQITYNDNPKTFVATGGYVVELTSNLNGQSFTSDTPIPDASSSGKWSLNGNILTHILDVTNDTSSTEILRGGPNNFSVDFGGMFGQSAGGAQVTFTSGEVSYERL